MVGNPQLEGLGRRQTTPLSPYDTPNKPPPDPVVLCRTAESALKPAPNQSGPDWRARRRCRAARPTLAAVCTARRTSHDVLPAETSTRSGRQGVAIEAGSRGILAAHEADAKRRVGGDGAAESSGIEPPFAGRRAATAPSSVARPGRHRSSAAQTAACQAH